MCRGVSEWIDDLQLLDRQAGPSVCHDQWQRTFMSRTDVNEVDVQPVDLGEELRIGVQLSFDIAPVVLRRPIARERLDCRRVARLASRR